MVNTTYGLATFVSVTGVLFLLSSSADAKHEQLGPYHPTLANYHSDYGERIPVCRQAKTNGRVRWWVTNSKGEIVISGSQELSMRC
jgi:hypothetical protein